MIRNVNNVNNEFVQNHQLNNCQHVQLGGTAFYDERKFFMFAPDEPEMDRVLRFRMMGVAQQMSDGTFDFVAKPRRRPQSQLIRKLAHGRVSKTKDGAIQLTLKVYGDEGVNIADELMEEASMAAAAVEDFQLRSIG